MEGSRSARSKPTKTPERAKPKARSPLTSLSSSAVAPVTSISCAFSAVFRRPSAHPGVYACGADRWRRRPQCPQAIASRRSWNGAFVRTHSNHTHLGARHRSFDWVFKRCRRSKVVACAILPPGRPPLPNAGRRAPIHSPRSTFQRLWFAADCPQRKRCESRLAHAC